MISIKYSETTPCVYSDYGCRDAICPLNKLHKPKEAFFGIEDIEPPGCIAVFDMLFDDSLDSDVRDWIKATSIKGKPHLVPDTFREITEGKKPKITPPLIRWMQGEDVVVGPGVVVPNNRRQPSVKNFIRHIWQHAFCFLYKIQMRRRWKRIHKVPKIIPFNITCE